MRSFSFESKMDVIMDELLPLTAEIVSAHVANNSVPAAELPDLIRSTFAALSSLGNEPEAEASRQEPAVSIRSSVKPDYIVCLEDGKKLKMLKRYLASHFDMTPAQYRTKWKLPMDYPMVAPNYSSQRKALAHRIGLGRKPAPASTPAKQGRKAAAKADAIA
jgi:predicted transcriptional regulator